VSSSLGLCGAFNINVCKFLINQIQSDDKIIVVGRKGFSYLKTRGFNDRIIDHTDFSDNTLDYLELLPLCEQIISYFNNQEFDEVHLIYTKFINSLTFTPICIQLLPFDSSLFKHPNQTKKTNLDLNEQNKEIMYEPNKEDILKSSLVIFVTTSLYAAVYESRVCENGSRRNAMETATDNAKELINELTLEFNEARQQSITQEINEIVAGADGSSV
jgi:F-type H+-transporting ATPase subunit gamma